LQVCFEQSEDVAQKQASIASLLLTGRMLLTGPMLLTGRMLKHSKIVHIVHRDVDDQLYLKASLRLMQ
jgi:hypothetical protein